MGPLLVAIIVYLSTINAANINNLPWTYDTVALWADFGTSNKSLLSDYQAEFIATHYDIISLEKCLAQPSSTGIPTEISFYKIASKMRKYASSNETKILMYFAIDTCYCDCYNITNEFYANQSMWWRDDNGNIIYQSGNPHYPCYDHTQQYVRDWWVQTVKNAMITAKTEWNITVNGIFGDGIRKQWNNPNISQARQDEYNQGIILLLNATRKAFAEINDDLYVIGNGISTYQTLPNNLDLFPYLDGMLGEHYGAFEEVINSQNGKINVTDLLFWFNVSKSVKNGVYGKDKTLLIKSWVGPETGPINGFGPSWPPTYKAKTPTTHEGVQNASSVLITFPLATYLCGIYNKYVYFNYAWWYNIEQGYVPCPDDPTSCDCPLNWYQEFTNKLGEPLGDGVISDTTKCNRSFENAEVYVDLNDDSSAQIKWK